MGIEDIEDVLTLASLHPDIFDGGTFFSFFTYHQNTFFLLITSKYFMAFNAILQYLKLLSDI